MTMKQNASLPTAKPSLSIPKASTSTSCSCGTLYRMDCRTWTETLKEIAAAASPGLLQGLNLGGQQDFDHVLSSEREAFRILHRDLLLELIGRLDRSPVAAVPYLQKLVEIEPYSLQAHYALIDKLVKAGRKGDAERQLQSSLSIIKDMGDIDLTALRQAAAGKPSLSDDVLISPEEPAHGKLDQQIRFCQSADGTRIAYATVGTGPPLVKTANWLNHLDFDWESPVWRHIFHGLADGRSLIRYDARGNGLSDWDAEDFSIERQVEDLEAVVESTGLDRFPLLGLSQGCAISVEYAARHPEKVTRLILVGGYARGWNRQGRPDVVRQKQAMMTLVSIGWGKDNPAFRQMFTSMFMPDAPPENQSWFNELQRITTTGQNAAKLMRAAGDVDITGTFADVRAPTLVMHCKNDMRIPFESGRELASGIPGARFVSLNSRNHLLPESDPAWPVMLREINEFLADCTSRCRTMSAPTRGTSVRYSLNPSPHATSSKVPLPLPSRIPPARTEDQRSHPASRSCPSRFPRSA